MTFRTDPVPTAIVTGGSAGLGRALVRELLAGGWRVITDARHEPPLIDLRTQLGSGERLITIAGDIADPAHRAELIRTAGDRLDVLINNASTLGRSPLPAARELEIDTLDRLWAVNVVAPLALIQAAWPMLAPAGVVIDVSSDAAVEHYPAWGGYGASKAALDHLTLTLAAEEPSIRAYAVDPGDMRTAMHQAAFPGEDISDRPEPETVAPKLIALIGSGAPSGRYRVADLPESSRDDHDLAVSGR
jgi:NAD(P)-dependent dehydrogenase (short-subunit alcohol dehydrogenase family)